MRRLSDNILIGLSASALGLLLAFGLPRGTVAQTRTGVIGGTPASQIAVGAGRYLLAGVGVDAYTAEAGWPVLGNAVADLDSLSVLLTKSFAFEVPEGGILRNEEASLDNIEALLERLSDPGVVGPDDNLIFFFAGHGKTETHAVGEQVRQTGYIIPHDGGDRRRSWLEIEDLLEALAIIPARHVLVILDSCESGIALDGGVKSTVATRGGGDGTSRGSGAAYHAPGSTAFERDLAEGPSRWVLTSAGPSEAASDVGPIEGNSLFTGWLLQGLRHVLVDPLGGPNEFDDPYLTAQELYGFVRDSVKHTEYSNQIPQFGGFELHDRGELALVLQVAPFDVAYRRALGLYEAGGEDKEIVDVIERALSTGEESVEAAYLKYILGELELDDAMELQGLTELVAFVDQGVLLPDGLRELTLRRRFQRLTALQEKKGGE